MYYMYCLQSLENKDWLYVSSTHNLKNRLTEHLKGKVHSTSRYLPIRFVYYESYLSKRDATQREYNLKHNNQQKERLKNRLKNSLGSPPTGDLP